MPHFIAYLAVLSIPVILWTAFSLFAVIISMFTESPIDDYSVIGFVFILIWFSVTVLCLFLYLPATSLSRYFCKKFSINKFFGFIFSFCFVFLISIFFYFLIAQVGSFFQVVFISLGLLLFSIVPLSIYWFVLEAPNLFLQVFSLFSNLVRKD